MYAVLDEVAALPCAKGSCASARLPLRLGAVDDLLHEVLDSQVACDDVRLLSRDILAFSTQPRGLPEHDAATRVDQLHRDRDGDLVLEDLHVLLLASCTIVLGDIVVTRHLAAHDRVRDLLTTRPHAERARQLLEQLAEDLLV